MRGVSVFAALGALALAGCGSFGESGAPDTIDAGADGGGADGGVTDAASGPDAAVAGGGDGGIVEGIPLGGKLVFVTHGAAQPPGATAMGFVAFADALCNSEAAAAMRSGTYVAWLATATASAIGRLPQTGHWYLRSGVEIGLWTTLNNGAIFAPIDRDAAGHPATGAHAVWTGTLVGGATAKETCMSWTLAVGTGVVGDYTLATAKWDANGTQACNVDARFYCFQL